MPGGDPRNLSFSTGFNQPKILINSSQSVSVPVSGALVADTLLTIPTGATRLPLPARVHVEYNGTLGPAYGLGGDTQLMLGVNIGFIILYDSSFNLVIKSYSQEAASRTMTIYYRVYIDSRSS